MLYNCTSATSIAHTYGNVTSFIRKFVEDSYPKDYFGTSMVSSMIGFRQFHPIRSKNKEFLKKSLPILVIKPRIDPSDEDKFLYGTLLTERMYDVMDGTDWGNLQELFMDKDRDLYMKFLLNRLKIMFDVTIIHESFIEAINMENYLRGRRRINHNFFAHTYLESYVPTHILSALSEQAGIPIHDKDGTVNKFLDYLNGHSVYPVTYKLKDSSGTEEFFFFYDGEIDMLISNISVDEGNKTNQVTSNFMTTFTITCEFFGMGLYQLFSSKPFPPQFENNPPIRNDGHILPLFSIPIYHMKAPENWNLYASSFYRVEKGHKGPDVTNFGSIIGESLDTAIKYHVKSKIPLNILLEFTVMEDGNFLIEGRDYEIDIEKYEITTFHPKSTKSYRLIIFANTLYMNDLKKTMFNLPVESK